MPQITLTKSNVVVSNSYIISSQPSTVYNTQTSLQVGMDGSGNTDRALLKFDLGLIPNDVIINSATLNLYQTTAPTVTNAPFSLHAITSDWVESSTSWSNQPSYSTTIKVDVNNPPATNGVSFAVDVKIIVEHWINNGLPNYGFLIKNTTESGTASLRNIASTRHATTAYQPTLTIDYTIPSTGKKCVEYVGATNAQNTSGNQTSIALTMPANIVQGDLLIAHIISSANNVINPASGWTQLLTGLLNSTQRNTVFYKFASASEPTATFSTSPAMNMTGVVFAVRNVKAIHASSSYATTGSSQSFYPGASMTASIDKTALFLINVINQAVNMKQPLSFTETYDVIGNHGGMEGSFKYLHKATTISSAEMSTSSSPTSGYGFSVGIILEPKTNNLPTLVLSSPTDNQILTEGTSYTIDGTRTDADSGNVVNVKFKINNGATFTLDSDVSAGSAIPFSKTLTYQNKRLWDGATDVTGVDLAENTTHTLYVWAEDDQGGVSAQVTRNFTVIWNRPPTINGTNSNLGNKSAPFTQTYTVTEPEGNTFTVTEFLNGVTKRTFAGTAGQQETFSITPDEWLRLDIGVPHEIKIRATDNQGAYSERVYTFTRTETQIVLELDYTDQSVIDFFTTDVAATRILVTTDLVLPTGATILVEVCNNAYDVSPTWEDATSAWQAGRGHLFANATKTASQWGVNIRITINKGSATDRVLLNGFGGAFD